jgi:hypothetical protein
MSVFVCAKDKTVELILMALKNAITPFKNAFY